LLNDIQMKQPNANLDSGVFFIKLNF